jgi:serine/threonine protein kinase
MDLRKLNHLSEFVGEEYLKSEMFVLRQLVHPHLLKYIGAKFVPGEGTIYIAMEFLGGETLRNFLFTKETGKSVGWRTRLRFAADLSDAVLHYRYGNSCCGWHSNRLVAQEER